MVTRDKGFEVLEQSPRVTPLLVELYDSHNLYNLARTRGNSESCRELATVMVDLLNIKLNQRETMLITDVMFGLMRQADRDLRIALADKLASMENAPLPMILGLVNDDIAVAEPILRKSPVLQDQDLLYIIKSKEAEHWRAIAQRKTLNATIVTLLAETEDFQTAVHLCNNDGAVLTRRAFEIFHDMAKTKEAIRGPLVNRRDLPADIAKSLITFVAQDLRITLMKRFGSEGEKAGAILHGLIEDFTSSNAQTIRTTKKDLAAQASRKKRMGQLTMSSMMAYLRRGQISSFIHHFAVFSRMTPDRIRAYLKEESAHNLALLCKACGLTKGEFITIYLLTGESLRPAQSEQFQQETLSRLMTMYDQIDESGAKKIMSGLQTEVLN